MPGGRPAASRASISPCRIALPRCTRRLWPRPMMRPSWTSTEPIGIPPSRKPASASAIAARMNWSAIPLIPCVMRNLSVDVSAVADPALAAVVVAWHPLYYAAGADPSIDRQAHVRAGSSIAWVPGGIALLQDDANFIALVDPSDGSARAIDLPAGAAGRRQFDDRRGNKAHKLDLEACVAADTADGVILIALGSGSTPRREQVALVRGWESGR